MAHRPAVFERATRKPLRWALTAFQGLRRAFWFIRGSRTLGAHAVPLTPAGRLVLVKLRYARGWRLPGGGRAADEDPQAAALRELREEIGLVRHGAVEPVSEIDDQPDMKREADSLFVVRDVEYQPRWSIEIESVTEAEPDALPRDLSNPARQWIELAMPRILGGAGQAPPAGGSAPSDPHS